MITFKEFLRQKEESLRTQEAAREEKQKRWVNTVIGLIEEMTAWLKEFDQASLLKLKSREVERTEESIGTYDLPELEIWLGGKAVSVRPVALDVVGPRWRPGDGIWSGRVDLDNGASAYQIYRFSGSDGTESWYLRDPRTLAVEPFTKDKFDSALVELFS